MSAAIIAITILLIGFFRGPAANAALGLLSIAVELKRLRELAERGRR